ncbi:MAG TPA: glycosyltransferase [Candidatus Eisenbacteria bacterium]|nr:glycosyltransferase [Candidatus Eisenbacteria bacterium]
MNVLVFTSLYPNNVQPNHGIFVQERVARVARLPGISVRVMAPVPWYPPFLPGARSRFRRVRAVESSAGLEVLHPRYAMIPKVGMPLHGPMMFRSLLAPLRALHESARFGLIDAHYLYPDGYAAVELGRALGLPVVVSARGSDVNRFAGFPRIRPMLRSTLAGAAQAIAVSAALRDRMVELGVPESRIEVIPNGVDLGTYAPRDRAASRARLGLPDRNTLLYVGNLVPGKGVEALIEGFALLTRAAGASGPAASGKDAGLVIVGAGPLRAALEERAHARGVADAVRFAGEVPHAALGDWYSAADALCLVSEREGWPNVLLEALACGTPIVATRVGGIPEIVTSDQFGILTGSDPREIAQAARASLERDWDRAVLRAHAERFTWERAAASVGRVFERALAAGPAAVAR